MINLLPPIEKHKRAQEKKLKLVWVLGILITVSLLGFVLILLSVNFYISNQVKNQEALVDLEKQTNTQVQILRKRIGSINKTLAELNYFYQEQFFLSAFLERLSDLLLSGMYLDTFSYEIKTSRVFLSCHAATIDEIYEFREKMRAEEDFEEVNFTVPDWLQSGDIKFQVNFNLKK